MLFNICLDQRLIEDLQNLSMGDMANDLRLIGAINHRDGLKIVLFKHLECHLQGIIGMENGCVLADLHFLIRWAAGHGFVDADGFEQQTLGPIGDVISVTFDQYVEEGAAKHGLGQDC